MKVLVIASLVALPIGAAAAQLPAGATPPSAEVLAARIDSVVKADLFPRGFPSVSIAVTRGGRPLLERAWGVADVSTGRKAEPSTTYQIASVAKQFTAALVLKLVDRGKVSLTDSIGRYVKGLRPEWNAITIDLLLNHTSGLASDFRQVSRAAEELPTDSLIAMAVRDTLSSKPGTAYKYSNTGYLLLGALIERVYGKPYAVVLRDEIARPLGLKSLGWCTDMPGNRAAIGYYRSSDGKPQPAVGQHPSQLLGAAAICSTAGDLARWNQALHGGRVLSPASYTAMTTPRGAAATTIKYGFGLRPRKSQWGSPAIGHDGESAGFGAHNAWFPAESLSVTLLYNGFPVPEVQMADFIGLIALGEQPRPIPPVAVIDLPVAATQGEGRPKFVGAYEISAGRAYIVTFEEGSLWITPPGGKRQQLVLQSGTTYKMGGGETPPIVTFRLGADGVVTGLTAHAGGVDRELRKIK